MKSKIRVLVDTPAWYIRPKNTDWLYMRQLKLLERHIDVEMVYVPDAYDALIESAEYVLKRLGKNSGTGGKRYMRKGNFVNRSEHRADIVLTHRNFPSDAQNIPVIWQYCVLDPRMQMANGRTLEAIETDYVDQAAVYERAALVQVSTVAEANRHALRFSHMASKFQNASFFLPHTQGLEKSAISAKHHAASPLKILFVGRDARRKGLDLLLDAYAALPTTTRAKCEFDIVSSNIDGVKIPDTDGIKWHRSLPYQAVLKLMREAHIFAMPSRFESFGFTYVEAMASGCAVIGPDWEVQTELLDEGRAGCLVSPDVRAIKSALGELCDSTQHRLDVALAGNERFLVSYAPDAVARAYKAMFMAIA